MMVEQHIPFFDLDHDDVKASVGDLEQGKKFVSDNSSLKIFHNFSI